MKRTVRAFVQIFTVLLALTLVIGNASVAREDEGLVIYSPILGIKSEPKRLSIPLTITNLLGESREVSFNVSYPKGWSCDVFYGDYGISKISLRSRESMNLTLVIEPSSNVTAGSYSIVVTALSGQVKSNALKIDVEIIKPSLGIELTTTSAEVTGSPGSVFSFSFNIKNNYYRDLTLGLSAEVPEGWYSLGFLPSSYETKVISDVAVRARSTYWGVTLQVWCPESVKPGTYPVSVTVSEPSEGIREKLEFRAVVTGTAKVTLKTEGGLLSYNVEAGKTVEIPLIIENRGTLPLRDISLYSYAPSGWKADITPAKITALPVGENATAILYLEPPPGAIAGDYSINVRAWSMEASHEITLRITVTKATYWGIVGVVVVVGAIFVLIFVSRRYGRL
ncbi:MAG: hypothetical protein HA491_00045 [Candidatus Verstraetearchaeota archaeon]|nr:hypothetical protein [Candidatus Verstraetearchaeota archaeon]